MIYEDILEMIKHTRVKQFKLNQIAVYANKVSVLYSYEKRICAVIENKVYLDKNYYKYSTTTSKYRNIFLNVTNNEFNKNLKKGKYILTNLN